MSVSLWQLLLILLVIILLFGPGRLPKLMSDLGKGLRLFKSSLQEDQQKDLDDSKK